MSPRCYLDHNATAPVRPEAREAMMAALDCAGNPSSVHAEGRAARAIVEGARERVAAVFGVKPSAVYFTSGGTEAANWLLQPLGEYAPTHGGNHRIEGSTPHPAPLPLGEGTPAQRSQHRPLSRPHPLADADIPKWPARQGELARERDRVRGDSLDHYSAPAGLAAAAAEHPCVLSGHRFEQANIQLIPVSPNGVLKLDALEAALSAGSVAAVQAANNETGVIQPLREIAGIAKAKGAFLVCDAVQAVGRLPLSLLDGVDALFFSAHKFGGPKGAGAAIVRNAAFTPAPLVRGGGQERRQRSGTENVPGIAGLAAALEAAAADRQAFAQRAGACQRKLESGLRAIAPDAVIFGEGADRLANTTCFAIPGKTAELTLMALDLDGIALSSGSACSSGKTARSHVLAAMGVPPELGACAIRVSTGWTTAEADIVRLLTALTEICSRRQARHGICSTG